MSNEQLKNTINNLNAKANIAAKEGDRNRYDELVDEMIEVENQYIDTHGMLP